jgi:hypothetical protein
MNIRLTLAGLASSAALLTISGSLRAQIFVANYNFGLPSTGSINEYTISGVPVKTPLVPDLTGPVGIAVSGGNLFVTNFGLSEGSTIGEYNATTGATVNASLISGLSAPTGIAVSGDKLFVVNARLGTIGEYTTSGATVNPTLISDLVFPSGIAVSGEHLFVTDDGPQTIREYTTSGVLVNDALVSLADQALHPTSIAVSGDKLFVTTTEGTIGKYTTSGATVNASLITGLSFTADIAVSGGHLFVTDMGDDGTIGEYTTSGATVNPTLVSGLTQPVGIAVVSASVPDGSPTWTLLLLALIATFSLKPLLRRPA